MPRELGRVACAIETAFITNPSDTFNVQELVSVVYPHEIQIEKSHKVVVARYAERVAPCLWWSSRRSPSRGRPAVYFNSLDVRSYALGYLRTDPLTASMSLARLRNLIDNPRGTMSVWEKMQPGGAFWREVELNKAQRDGRPDIVAAMQAELHTCG